MSLIGFNFFQIIQVKAAKVKAVVQKAKIPYIRMNQQNLATSAHQSIMVAKKIILQERLGPLNPSIL